MSASETTTRAASTPKIDLRVFDDCRYCPDKVDEALARLDREEEQLRKSSAPALRDESEPEKRLWLARQKILTALPVHRPFEPAAPRPELDLQRRTIPPFVAPIDRPVNEVEGHFEFRDEAAMTDHLNGLVGSRFKAVAMDASRVADATKIHYARDSAVLLPSYTLTRPARIKLWISMQLQAGWSRAVFFDKRPGDLYLDLYLYHVPFATIAAPFPVREIFAWPYPGLHGVQNYWSILGGRTETRSTPETEAAWNFGSVAFQTPATEVLRPGDYCISVGVRHMVQVLAQYVRFEVDSGAQWKIGLVDIIET